MFNAGFQPITIRAKDSGGSVWNVPISWRVTDQISDTVVQNWIQQPSLTLSGSSTDRSYAIDAKLGGQQIKIELDIVAGVVSYGAGGNPHKRTVSTSYPYAQERDGACSLGCLRNVEKIFGKSVSTEDEIVQILAANGKPESDFWDVDTGMGGNEAESRFNQVLDQKGLKATRKLDFAREEMKNQLASGKVFIVGTSKNIVDLTNGTIKLNRGHMVVIRQVGNKVEVIDPDGNGHAVVKKMTVDEALDRYPVWTPSPPILTSNVWLIEPKP